MSLNIKWDRIVKPFGSNNLYMAIWTRRIKDNNLLLNIELESEFPTLRSKMIQLFKIVLKEMKEFYTVFLYSSVCFRLCK